MLLLSVFPGRPRLSLLLGLLRRGGILRAAGMAVAVLRLLVRWKEFVVRAEAEQEDTDCEEEDVGEVEIKISLEGEELLHEEADFPLTEARILRQIPEFAEHVQHQSREDHGEKPHDGGI